MNEKSAADKKCIVSITHIGQCGPIYLHALNSFRVHLIEIKRMCSPNGLRVSECVCVCVNLLRSQSVIEMVRFYSPECRTPHKNQSANQAETRLIVSHNF